MKKYIIFCCLFIICSLFIGCDNKPTLHNVCSTDNNFIKGIDVSHYQKGTDWNKVKISNIEFAFARVSDGNNILDREFQYNWGAIKQAGIIRGAYQFFRPEQGGLNQAILFEEIINKNGGMDYNDLPPVIDVEVSGGQSPSVIINEIGAWINHIESKFNRIPIIYTGAYFWDQNKLGASFANYPVWIAHYTESLCPLAPSAWNRWEFWQYSGSGSVGGINIIVDLNYYNGTRDELLQFINRMNIKQEEIPEIDGGIVCEPDADIIIDEIPDSNVVNNPETSIPLPISPPKGGCSYYYVGEDTNNVFYYCIIIAMFLYLFIRYNK